MRIAPNKIILTLLGFLGCNIVFAADSNGPPPPVPPPPGLSVDGWIAALIVMSIFYGLYKLNQIKKASN